MSSVLLSICIPTYNGANHLKTTLDSIVPHLDESIELVICDDCSTDFSVRVAQSEKENNGQIRIFTNKVNVGMDRNFHRVVNLAKGEYIWFCGQDDILGGLAINKAKEILIKEKPSVLNMNFSQYDHDWTNCLIPSFFERASFDPELIQRSDTLVFESSRQYFKIFTQPPSFLPAVIMRKIFWETTKVEMFYDTHFVQVGVALVNFDCGKICTYNRPLVKGRVPNDQWQIDGEKLFFIMTGDLKAKIIAFKTNPLLPNQILRRDTLKFILNFPFLLAACTKMGLEIEEKHRNYLKKSLSNPIAYYILLYPFTVISSRSLIGLTEKLKTIKQLLLKINYIERLRG
jgi:glycosyltransferase involved in cell wall biosynthesis